MFFLVGFLVKLVICAFVTLSSRDSSLGATLMSLSLGGNAEGRRRRRTSILAKVTGTHYRTKTPSVLLYKTACREKSELQG